MSESPVQLVSTPAGLSLVVTSSDPDDVLLTQGKPVVVDWLKLDITSPLGRSLQQPILKAAGIRKGDPHRPRVLDVTAGYGEDAWLFASHGCDVTAIERNAIVFEVLQDAHRRAAQVHPDIAARITLMHGDAKAFIASQPTGRFDVIHLDPMFPTGRRATERKPMRVLRRLVGDDDDAGALLKAALQTLEDRSRRERVIVKRPLKAAALIEDPKPMQQHKGNAVRYDVYG